MGHVNTLQDFLVEQLRDLYSSETQIIANLPKMAKQASHSDLRQAFESHLRETEGHKERLERIAAILDFKPAGHTCEAMKGIVREAAEWISENAPDDVRDAGLISNAQRVEHYEISRYGTMRTWANELGLKDAVKLLDQTLAEEKKTDATLTEIAESVVNQEAEAA